MGLMTDRNAFRWHLMLLLAALVVLAGVQPGLAEDQDIERLRQAAEQETPGRNTTWASYTSMVGERGRTTWRR